MSRLLGHLSFPLKTSVPTMISLGSKLNPVKMPLTLYIKATTRYRTNVYQRIGYSARMYFKWFGIIRGNSCNNLHHQAKIPTITSSGRRSFTPKILNSHTALIRGNKSFEDRWSVSATHLSKVLKTDRISWRINIWEEIFIGSGAKCISTRIGSSHIPTESIFWSRESPWSSRLNYQKLLGISRNRRSLHIRHKKS